MKQLVDEDGFTWEVPDDIDHPRRRAGERDYVCPGDKPLPSPMPRRRKEDGKPLNSANMASAAAITARFNAISKYPCFQFYTPMSNNPDDTVRCADLHIIRSEMQDLKGRLHRLEGTAERLELKLDDHGTRMEILKPELVELCAEWKLLKPAIMETMVVLQKGKGIAWLIPLLIIVVPAGYAFMSWLKEHFKW